MSQDLLEFWTSVSKTDPKHTKHVSYGKREFTAIDAYYQIKMATEKWGPCGGAWHYKVDLTMRAPEGCDPRAVWLACVSLYTPLGDKPVVQYGCKSFFNSKGDTDEDAPKKAVTDGLTKCFSYLGFSSDVFLGRFDDNKYVEQMKREFAENAATLDQVTAIRDLWAKLGGGIPAAKAHEKAWSAKHGIALSALTTDQAAAMIGRLETSVSEKEAANAQ